MIRMYFAYTSLTRRYIWAWDWLRGGEVVFPRSTDCVRVVALGELTLCDRLISWAADVVARLILNQRKAPNHNTKKQRQRNKYKFTYWGTAKTDILQFLPVSHRGPRRKKVLVLVAAQFKPDKAMDANFICTLSPSISVSTQLQ